ncbi:OmpA family protein [Aquimarina sp. 2201CG5-10]|uniref:OmpA family protein n=1 Tax=Aquimarina callyspongiae TaxID=3098150 RepID=UPI002AB3FE22|nr:OmpA family protein [Aquimarina sp. 2201CG5-10]MDY8135734.1 OmpA family protein [Aquimarina sp. 2201CG5-10]
MKNLITLFIFLLFSWLGIWWYYSCSWCEKDGNSGTFVTKDKVDSEAEALAKKAYDDSIAHAKLLENGLAAIDDQNRYVFRYPANFQINNANGNVSIPSALDGFNDKVATYLRDNQDKELIITGYETRPEQQSGVSLGLARANFIKKVLIDNGINGDRIVSKATINDYKYNAEGTYNGGILFNFNRFDESRLAEIEEGIANKTLYSGFGEKTFKPDATLSNYAQELKNYLTKYPDKKVQIVGHTDDKGPEDANLWFGQQRANNVRSYLISQGIISERIVATSKGETDPIVPNSSDENRSKNRRIEIIVN